jgi:hypothetical protein
MSITFFKQKDPKLKNTIKLAKEALNYARKQIIKGSTQIENNIFLEKGKIEYFDSLNKGIDDLRDYAFDLFKDSIQEPKSIFIELEKDILIRNYEHKIYISSKFSIGNCEELALQAFDYILYKSTGIFNAEIFRIDGGDHAFLVLNRDPDSIPSDPKNWGPHAVICDPWANKVYNASEYLSKLKNFNSVYDKDTKIMKNGIESFNSKIHTLEPKDELNISYFNEHRNINVLKIAFNEKLDIIEITLPLLNASKNECDAVIDEITDLKINCKYMLEDGYREIKKKLKKELEKIYKIPLVAKAWNYSIEICIKSQEEKKVNFDYKNKFIKN